MVGFRASLKARTLDLTLIWFQRGANNGVFQEFLVLVGKMVHSDLVRQMEYLKVENQILRSKLGRRISVTPSERRRIVKYGLPLGG